MFAAQDRVIAYGVDCRRIGEAAWTYVSLAPWPQMAPDGTPMVSVLEAGAIALVQLSAQLDPPGRMLEDLRASLADPETATPVTLTSAVTSVRTAEVSLGQGGDGAERRVLATSAGSGYPPYTAVFSLQATADIRDAFVAALRGEAGRIAIAYDAETDRGPAHISADLADWTRIR